jgi:esterase/lipase
MRLLKNLTLDKKKKGLVISIALIIIGVIPLIIFTFLADTNHPYEIEQTTLISEDGTRIEALIYTPKGISHEGIVVGHGYCGNKQYMQPLCIELVKRGFTVVNIDFRGHGSSDGHLLPSDHENRYFGLKLDMEAAIDYLEDIDEIEKIGLVGHSMGGHTAVITAEDNSDKIEATVSLGHIPLDDYDFEDISNLLVAIGQYEQTSTKEDAVEFLEEYTGRKDVKIGTLYGNFDDGDACKAIIGEYSEHLAGIFNPTIVTEMVQWFEQAFNEEKATNIKLTVQYTQIFFGITLFGVLSLVFVIIIYFSNYLFKNGITRPETDIIKDISIKKLCAFYIISVFIGVLLLNPLNLILNLATPVAQANTILALLIGTAIGILIIYYFILRRERRSLADISSKFKIMCSENPKLSLFYGVTVALLFTVSIAAISHWSNTATIPTFREILTIFWITGLFFPFIFLKEFYFRTIQGRLKESKRLKEYFKMTGIGIFIDNIFWIPIMLALWGTDFLALSLTVVVLMSIIQQVLVTWVYMHSGRNILGSALFLSLLYAWMIINFFPFEYI